MKFFIILILIYSTFSWASNSDLSQIRCQDPTFVSTNFKISVYSKGCSWLPKGNHRFRPVYCDKNEPRELVLEKGLISLRGKQYSGGLGVEINYEGDFSSANSERLKFKDIYRLVAYMNSDLSPHHARFDATPSYWLEFDSIEYTWLPNYFPYTEDLNVRPVFDPDLNLLIWSSDFGQTLKNTASMIFYKADSNKELKQFDFEFTPVSWDFHPGRYCRDPFNFDCNPKVCH
ncbi:MAG: hypothetical protein HOO06_05650 [Bdellovibrionaceae bacterium]|jgi:hypothetical protein|nr:hypothetical protein [Pseudobdellovibrionaceae bacterium]